MARHPMVWTMAAWVLTTTAMAMAASPLPSTSDCIPQGSYCMDTMKPCCQSAELQDGRVIHDEQICFIFGEGLCQPFYEIRGLALYAQLVRQLNDSNYVELRREYRRNLIIYVENEWTDSQPIPTPVVRNDTASKVTEARVAPAPVVRNDTATNSSEAIAVSAPVVGNDAAKKWSFHRVVSPQLARNYTGAKRVVEMRTVRYDTTTKSSLVNDEVTYQPVPNLSLKAWTRYKCNNCDVKINKDVE